MVNQRAYAARIRALQELQRAQGMDCVALVPGANLRYFTGLAGHLSERPLVAFFPASGGPAVALPALEVPGARALLPDDVQLLPYSDEEGHNIQDLVITPTAPLYVANFPSNYDELSLFANGLHCCTLPPPPVRLARPSNARLLKS